MKYTGKIRGGVVVLEGAPALREGTVVAVEPIEDPGRVGQRLRRFSGLARGLPRDMARNHDHYLHARPKR